MKPGFSSATASFMTASFMAGLCANPSIAASHRDLPVRLVPPDHPCRAADERFHRFHEKDGVLIRTAEEPDGTTIVRSEEEVTAAPEVVADLLADIGGWSRWVKRVRRSERLSGDPPAFHVVVDSPWPFSDRDYGLTPAVDRDENGALVLWWESAAGRLEPPPKGVIRVTRIRGGFVLDAGQRPGTTHVVYSDVAVLGGKLPRWAIRESYKRGPVGILGALRRELTP